MSLARHGRNQNAIRCFYTVEHGILSVVRNSRLGKGKDAMFTKLYHERIIGVIAGLDRIRFRGTNRMLSYSKGFEVALGKMGILLKDFGKWAEKTTQRLRACCTLQAQALGIPMRYLRKSGVDKDALARDIAEEHGIAQDGSICMFNTLEFCVAPTIRRNRETRRLEIRMLPRKCVFIYYYFDHPQVGFGHVCLQTWAPYSATICLNGRHWLEKQLKTRKVAYLKAGNCFPWIANVALAQQLLDAQLETQWPELLNDLVLRLCPSLPTLCPPVELRYYWSADQTEFATDVMFRSQADIDALFPALVLYGMRVSDCRAVLRYFGKPAGLSRSGRVPNDIQTDCKRRHEGIRIKHWVNGDSIKAYNKQSLLRVETTINNARNFKAFRSANDDPTKPCTWQKMRKGVSDLHRRCAVSRKSNERYLDALSAAAVNKTLHEAAQDACNPTSRHGRPVRGLNPWNEQDFKLLTFLAKGEWAINGFRNKNLRAWLDPDAQTLPSEVRKKLSAKATRLIGILRAHGLVRKVPRENRYVLSETGQTFAHALLIASSTEVKRLTDLAA